MNDNPIAELLDTLYLELVSEIDIHCDGMLDTQGELLSEAIKNAIKSTRQKLCGMTDVTE
ncbi:MAG: hypothetical protein J6D08_16600 [Lachnospiraceae bacterium]|nr:hypothetical protein [Lachnospiraceae bacterium]